ncbi:MAG: hypothetical protein EOP24_39845 [Hyphomicrobiales bacterium]|nr:MAG: hypothetical protein EOP24_39845 [Hyphomicrobiales bacterium]
MESIPSDDAIFTTVRLEATDLELYRAALLTSAFRCIALRITDWPHLRVMPFNEVFFRARRFAPGEAFNSSPETIATFLLLVREAIQVNAKGF